jgi:hypothetical protein
MKTPTKKQAVRFGCVPNPRRVRSQKLAIQSAKRHVAENMHLLGWSATRAVDFITQRGTLTEEGRGEVLRWLTTFDTRAYTLLVAGRPHKFATLEELRRVEQSDFS